tara:strand:+ start:1852 stop:2226 length:375 start_codon:yes stop_codon:yes gene_type:complete
MFRRPDEPLPLAERSVEGSIFIEPGARRLADGSEKENRGTACAATPRGWMMCSYSSARRNRWCAWPPNAHLVHIPTRQDDCLRPDERSDETGRDTGQDASAGTIQAFRRGFEKKKFQTKRLVCA